MISIIIFISGLVIGSFLNVCIYRMPNGESIISPSSHCVHCKHSLPWHDNIPVLSFILLKGRCRFCKKGISPTYIIVELLTAFLLVLTYSYLGLKAPFFIYALLFSGLIISTFVDFKHKIIPDEITYGGMALGLIISILYPDLHHVTSRLQGLFLSILGLIAGGGSIYLTGVIGKMLFKKEAMGGGDVKLMAMIGAFLGWKYVLLIFFLAPFFGSAVGIIMLLKYKKDIIPYGPYLSLATVITVFYGGDILKWVFRL